MQSKEIQDGIKYRNLLNSDMDLKGIGGSVGNTVRINDYGNFFFFYNGTKFDYKNF